MYDMTDDSRVSAEQSLMKPNQLLQQLPLSTQQKNFIRQSRETLSQIISGKDKRFLVVVGPCSIHDDSAALEYAHQLKQAADQFADKLFIVMRAYFEKPRTVLGWKGLISDPKLDGSVDINLGLTKARKLLLAMTELGLPAATEFLDTLLPQYFSDLISWCAIGARTTESQIHRELASGLSMPVGFKNSTDGNYKIAIDAVNTARHSHRFIGLSKSGEPTFVTTTGNPHCHIVLRGSHSTPNYSSEQIDETIAALQEAKLAPRLMVDCSHGNSMRDFQQQKTVVDALAEQLRSGSQHVFGTMLESNLVSGKQAYTPGETLVYGQSITDACLSWEETLPLLEKLAKISVIASERSQ